MIIIDSIISFNSYILIKSNYMGAISSMCCENDKDSKVIPPIPPPPKAKPQTNKNMPINVKPDPKIQNSIDQKGQSNDIKIPEE